MSNFNWNNATAALVGAEVKPGLVITAVDEKVAIATRAATGSTIRATRRKAEATAKALADGEVIGFRKISYTSAVEATILHILGDLVAIDTADRVYRAPATDDGATS